MRRVFLWICTFALLGGAVWSFWNQHFDGGVRSLAMIVVLFYIEAVLKRLDRRV